MIERQAYYECLERKKKVAVKATDAEKERQAEQFGDMVFYISFWNRQNADAVDIEKNNIQRRYKNTNNKQMC